MATEKEMSWQDAVLKILSTANEPMDYNEITRQIDETGLRTLTGATPATTVNRTLCILLEQGKVVRTGRGLYAVQETAKRSEEQEAAEEIAAEKAAADPNQLTVKAYGLYWARNIVDWDPVRGQLWGQQNESASPVNFANQKGLYFLHSWNEIVYVGQTFTSGVEAGLYGRLRIHHTDRDKRKSDRWDTFSWFGFRSVDEKGELGEPPSEGKLASVIDVIEAMFIEALMPRLNMQTGRGSKLLRETGLYFQSSLKRVSRGFR